MDPMFPQLKNYSGQSIAKKAHTLGMKVIVAERKGAPTSGLVSDDLPEFNLQTPNRVPFTTVLQKATVIVVICPLTPETRDMISTAEMNIMLPNALLINCARGGIVNEEALAAALNKGKIAGAAADVLSNEPCRPDANPLLQMDKNINFLPTPHSGWFSQTTLRNYTLTMKSNVESFLAGTPQNRIA
jgi:lactate dehydrogenase-like 2-hydroxyacid dehydrogenase